MPELTPSPSVPPLLDPTTIEARLNALTGHSDTNSDPREVEALELQDQFLADSSLSYLGSRSKIIGTDGEPCETLIEYHRIELEPQQTRAILHLRFRTDFSLAPSVEVTLIDASGRTRVTGTTIFGSRIEITLAEPRSESTTISIETICTNCSNE